MSLLDQTQTLTHEEELEIKLCALIDQRCDAIDEKMAFIQTLLDKGIFNKEIGNTNSYEMRSPYKTGDAEVDAAVKKIRQFCKTEREAEKQIDSIQQDLVILRADSTEVAKT